MFLLSPVAGIRALFERAAAYFLPPSITSDREATNQARMFLVSHLFGPSMGVSVPAALYAFDPTPEYDIAVLAVGIAAFLVFPFLLRWGWDYRRLVLLSILNLNFVIFWSCFHYGGVHSPTLVWVLIIPILSVFYIGGDERQKMRLILASAACCLLFMCAYLTLSPDPNDIPAAAMEVLGATSAVAVMCYVAVMAVYYARIFDAGVDLEREVARRRLMSIELRRSVEAADRAASMKSEFLAKMSHELRSPLNAIIGYGELLKEDCDDRQDDLMQADLDKILEAGAYLTRLIDMILDLAKVDAGKMQFNPGPHDLCDILDIVLRNQQDLIAANGNTVSMSIEPDVRLVKIDGSRLVQIVESIVKNAATHTQNGTITIEVWPTEIAGLPAFEIIVRDTGCGIPPEILAVIFETFLVDREASNGRYGGTGLALSVTSKLCEAMGGKVTAKSAEGVGSTLTVTLPLAPIATRGDAAAELADAA